ncbi:Protoheme IX farnesyltransferase [Buchnera aphidicola (Periphyllus testudinaceus)]|uniref:heme o synthase n=1 Tax=Buchnera aphidicola TaxID=9 RepID=UPI0034641DA5
MSYIYRYLKKDLMYYLELIKPRILFSNLLSAISGYFFGLKNNSINFLILFYMIFGLFCIISCGCVLNNIFDRKNDKKMKRTMNRVLVKKKCFLKKSIIFSFFLFFIGSFFLYFFVNKLVYLISCIGLFVYVIFYTIFLKKKCQYSTIVGAISGSCPILIGYFSVSHYSIFLGICLFFIFFFWQIPHSYSVSLLYLKDYKKAHIKVFPVVNNFQTTLTHMYFCINLLIFFTFIFGFFSYLNDLNLTVLLLFGFFWLFLVSQGFKTYLNPLNWILKIFKFSIFYIICFNIFICFNYI